MSGTLFCDVLVAGSGAGGLAAALAARVAGLDVVLIEKAALFGGTTAHSEGMIWVPGNHHAEAQGKHDDAASPLDYLKAAAGNHLDRDKAEAYIEAARKMLAFIERHSRIRYALAGSLDYDSELPGATAGTRSLRVEPIDGRVLGPVFDMVRPPLRSTVAFGGMTVTGADLPAAMSAHRSLRSFLHMARLAARYGLDRFRGYSRGTRIGNGHALVACLVEALLSRRATLLPDTRLDALVIEGGRVAGASVSRPDGVTRILARRGVVLACGGFSNDPALQARFYPRRGADTTPALLAAETSTGDGIQAALEAGAVIGNALAEPAAWTPASLVPQSDGTRVAFPHYLDRNKPGFIAVDRQGRRFANEAATYHRFVAALLDHCRSDPAAEAWLVADSRAVSRYGIGAAPPFPLLLRQAVRRGYVTRAATLKGLAHALGLPEANLAETVARWNGFARAGADLDFGRGETAYERACGDPAAKPNPSLGPIEHAPFYAVKIVPSDIGTFVGLRTDARARALDGKGLPIPGLHVAGNDAASAFGGTYPAAGITVGLALTFGFIAGDAIAKETVAHDSPNATVTPVT